MLFGVVITVVLLSLSRPFALGCRTIQFTSNLLGTILFQQLSIEESDAKTLGTGEIIDSYGNISLNIAHI